MEARVLMLEKASSKLGVCACVRSKNDGVGEREKPGPSSTTCFMEGATEGNYFG